MNLKFLIKFTKAQWADDIQNKGSFYFNPAYKFFTSDHYSLGQFDRWDSHVKHNALDLVWAPIIEESENGIKYGPVQKFADKAELHIIHGINKKIPICCFRMIYDTEIKDGILRFDDPLYKQVQKDFPDYDSFALICFPSAFFDILSKSHWGDKAFGSQVYYDQEKFEEFYSGNGDIEFEDKYPYYQMFGKEEKFEYQQEFRMILPTQQWDKGSCIEIGSLEQIVFVGKIEQLQVGYCINQKIESGVCYYNIEEII